MHNKKKDGEPLSGGSVCSQALSGADLREARCCPARPRPPALPRCLTDVHPHSKACGNPRHLGIARCSQQTGWRLSARASPSLKPQVPPKPLCFKPGQERDFQIPPAPQRPLPANPRTPETQAPAPSSVSILIGRFESIRKPPLGLTGSLVSSAWSMEPSVHLSTLSSPVAALGGLDAGPGRELQPLQPQNVDLGKPRELPVGAGTHHEGHKASGLGLQVSSGDGPLDTGPTGEPGGCGKLPNRDSGIDSPSCSVAGENFSCEEGAESGKGPIPPGLSPETDSDSSTPRGIPQEEADSDVDEGSGEEPEVVTVPQRASVGTDVAKCPEPQKLLNIARELLHTEEAYVKRLHLLDQVFCTKLTEAGIPPEVTTGIFSNISSIYCFHGQFLLPELQTRITREWDANPRLGDILQKLAPFLKMYGEYVKNFDRAMELVSLWTQRSLPFKDVIHNIQKQELCGNLTLQHHMLEPVQRVPRYELLLKDYLKRLPRDAPDRKDAEKSLELISIAANHSNAAIRKMEKMHKLLEVYEQLGGEEDIVNPADELVKEGHIQKLSAKNGTAQDRHLFLFSSMILYCVPKLRLMGQKFSVREKMDISDLQVQDIVKPNAAPTFIITGKKRSLELQTRTEEEKKEWIQVIRATIEKHRQNSETFKAFSSTPGQDEDPTLTPDSPVVGTSSVEPACVADGGGVAGGVDSRKPSSKSRRDKEKHSCKSCGETFNSITKRRHHCKRCGAVICGKCSEFKAENSRQSRVCKECFLTQSAGPQSPSSEKLPASDPQQSLLCSYLQLWDGGTAWDAVWASIPKMDPLVLHLQGVGQDGPLPRAIPLPGCTVTVPESAERPDARHAVRLQRAPAQPLFLSAETPELQRQWLGALDTAARGDTARPSPGSLQPPAHPKGMATP
ncbi:FYVE, RhoGEF and PH domain-containing protein 3 isoform X2 [Choloepus didactylus]|uniref:FYVE, RhoGEF and PH domain-containing protein 3 isoform X2 n=1 Tax=Choloepus didactylus TaxID=27675 RepID=UPI00189C6BF0|nr:FYVE, RhoGEF and PH domain-containing protein 3 isoform X2 [Choloepus didactylus]